MSEKTDEKTPPTETSKQALERARPLNATMVKNLKELVDNDYALLKEEMNSLAEEEKIRREDEIRAEATQEEADDLTDRANDLVKAYNDTIDALIREARDKGLTLSAPRITIQDKEVYDERRRKNKVLPAIRVTDERIESRVNQMKVEINRDLNTALQDLRKAQLASQRQVILSGVTQDAELIANGLPSAQDILIKAARERADRAANRSLEAGADG